MQQKVLSATSYFISIFGMSLSGQNFVNQADGCRILQEFLSECKQNLFQQTEFLEEQTAEELSQNSKTIQFCSVRSNSSRILGADGFCYCCEIEEIYKKLYRELYHFDLISLSHLHYYHFFLCYQLISHLLYLSLIHLTFFSSMFFCFGNYRNVFGPTIQHIQPGPSMTFLVYSDASKTVYTYAH